MFTSQPAGIKIFLSILILTIILGFTLIIYGGFGPWYNSKPLYSPITFATENPQIFHFSLSHSDEYQIALELEQTGLDSIFGTPFKNRHVLIDMTWELFDGDKIIHLGSTQTDPWFYSWYGPPAGNGLWVTRLEAGHDYSLKLNVHSKNVDWDKYNPKILIWIPSDNDAKIIYLISGTILIVIANIILFSIGGVFLLKKMFGKKNNH